MKRKSGVFTWGVMTVKGKEANQYMDANGV